jgi:hypothetical protein
MEWALNGAGRSSTEIVRQAGPGSKRTDAIENTESDEETDAASRIG